MAMVVIGQSRVRVHVRRGVVMSDDCRGGIPGIVQRLFAVLHSLRVSRVRRFGGEPRAGRTRLAQFLVRRLFLGVTLGSACAGL